MREKIKFLSADTINALKYLMHENTLNGTAKKSKLEGFNIGGKAATGEKADGELQTAMSKARKCQSGITGMIIDCSLASFFHI